VTVVKRENLVLLEIMVPLVTLVPQERRVLQVYLDHREMMVFLELMETQVYVAIKV